MLPLLGIVAQLFPEIVKQLGARCMSSLDLSRIKSSTR